MKAHELAAILPELPTDELAQLAEDVKENGQREYIVTLDGQILDGRNRMAACRIAKVEPRTRVFGSRPEDGDDPVAFVISQNLKRRHLSDAERARIAGELAAQSSAGRPKAEDSEGGSSKKPITRAKAAKMLNVSEAAVKRAVKVAKKGGKQLKEALKKGKVSLSKAATASAAPKPKQAKAAKAAPKPKQSAKEKMNDALNAMWIEHRDLWNAHPMATPAAMVKHFQNLIDKTL